jgi:hypothetical protein
MLSATVASLLAWRYPDELVPIMPAPIRYLLRKFAAELAQSAHAG